MKQQTRARKARAKLWESIAPELHQSSPEDIKNEQPRDVNAELLAALKDAVEIIEGVGLDASVQRAAIAKATMEDSQ
jgi:hypothetical protein